jgi:hypothetical protein
VIYEETAPDTRSRMDLDSCEKPADLRKHTRQERDIEPIQPVRQAMRKDRMKAWIAEKYFERTLRSGISVKDRVELLSDGSKHLCLVQL